MSYRDAASHFRHHFVHSVSWSHHYCWDLSTIVGHRKPTTMTLSACGQLVVLHCLPSLVRWSEFKCSAHSLASQSVLSFLLWQLMTEKPNSCTPDSKTNQDEQCLVLMLQFINIIFLKFWWTNNFVYSVLASSIPHSLPTKLWPTIPALTKP